MADTDRIVVHLSWPLAAGGTGALCAGLAARVDGGGALVEIRVDGRVGADLLAVEALARLRLTAARLGCRTVVRGAGIELVGLLHTVGLGFLVTQGTGEAGAGAGPGGGT
ncbi:hypothetical protein [Streptomyces sp. NBC_01497]|uniref:hypothetical protein n=1 Tax=Streptomyces sp. NBC_01497 TaxID=2903885 RepID=UPI002E3685B1|nr:hypothetical protein [Streptomyces sp. NBC_01497]